MKTYFWLRRDLNIQENVGLFQALKENKEVQPLFIFDDNILNELPSDDARVSFIYDELYRIHLELQAYNCSLLVKKGTPITIFENLLQTGDQIYANHDYEPYAMSRDAAIKSLITSKGGQFYTFKNQVIFEKNEVVKDDDKPYTVFTPYKRKWLEKFHQNELRLFKTSTYTTNFKQSNHIFPSRQELSLAESNIKVLNWSPVDDNYKEYRDFPTKNSTSLLSPHLRFGTVSIREIVKDSLTNEHFLSELIWREFFMQILWHFPDSIHSNFKRKYDLVSWRNNEEDIKRWKSGTTGYPIVDAGIRELLTTGYMHNRVRMIVAGFLCKHLLVDWRIGEAFFAEHLLDYELSSNVGNWQWAAGTGCDAAPYFRIFNPMTQLQKFDKELIYTKTWVKDFDTLTYPTPMVDHRFARERCLNTYKSALE